LVKSRPRKAEGKPVRSVIGVYSSDEDNSAQAFQALAAKFGNARLFSEQETSIAGEAAQRYSALRLEGEALIVVDASPSKVPEIVEQLQSSGSPGVFVVTKGLSDLLPPQKPAPPPETKPALPVEDFARICARRRGTVRTAKPVILNQLKESEQILDVSRRDLAEAARLEHALTAAAEWLLDNGYLLRTQIAEIRRHLPRDHHKILPAGDSGEPYIYELAQELVGHTDQSLNEINIRECLTAYQEIAPLTIAELWSFALMLRMALIAELAHLAMQASQKQQLREAAYFWANRLAVGSRRGPDVFQNILQRMAAEPVSLEPYFLTCLVEQLQDEEDALAPLQHWIEDRLKTPLTEVVRSEQTREAAEAISTANAFGSLRAMARINFAEVFESTSLMEVELRKDPSGTYSHSDFGTRDRCRRAVERISRHSGVGELDVARRAVAMAAAGTDPQSNEVAFYLLDDGVAQLESQTHARLGFRLSLIRALRRRATAVYLVSNIGLTICFTVLALTLAWDAGVRAYGMLTVLGLLALFPLSELALQTINTLVISLLPPETLPKLDFQDGIPPEQATLVVIPMMLSSADVIKRELEKLEVRFLANQESSLFFSLFSDFMDAATETASGDAELLGLARDGIAQLNQRYPAGSRFLLFHRNRLWSQSEQCWIGRERKRGKIEELNAFLSGVGSNEILQVGSLPLPVRYVITLDADTQLPPGTARRMIETIAHPLNQVVIDPTTNVRKRGFTIIQPRVSIALPGATATRFTRIFADTTGTDPYCQTVSDAQQDLFGEAIFHGKAIYDLHAFRTILADRFPPETLLSHDLIEGAHVGVALASEIELFENLPLDYAGFSRRQHRWIRGDWQIAPWIFDRVPAPGGAKAANSLSIVGRWRILDNLRRSLVPVASLLLLLFGWLISRAPGVWTLVIGLAVAIPALAPLLDRVARHIQGTVHGWRGAADEVIRALVMLVFLPHQAWLAMDAIVRVFYRKSVSRQNLLEWQPAESGGGQSQRELIDRQMWLICASSIALMLLLGLRGAIAPTAVFVALWALSPAMLRWLDRSAPPRDRRRLPLEDTLFLHTLARKTWRYFDDLVGEETHWLPPDNSQLSLHIEVAQRTSPTNIGLWLTSALAAHDLGYLSTDELLRRSANTMETIGLLERYEGHLLNWYDTRTLEPLLPRYVSTVDSGNLLASLWVIEQGFHDTLRAPVIGPSCLRGLADTVAILDNACGSDPSVSGPLRALRRLLHGKVKGDLIGRLRTAANPVQQLQEIGRWPDAAGEERSYWVARVASELTSWAEMVDRYLPWMETLTHLPDSFLRELGDDAVKLRHRALHTAPSLASLAGRNGTAVERLLARPRPAGIRPEVGEWLDRVDREYRFARENAAQTVNHIEALIQTAKQLSAGMNMGFLYDKNRRLFGIGYLVGSPLEFSSHYDLLASECRLGSMVAIAKGDIPMEHWFSLGRPHVSSPDGQVLLSWTGTMFEFLMPLLFMRTFANSLLDQACHEAVHKQMEYGKSKKVPWGVSESAYSALDANQIYQYRAFGIPSLALKQELTDDVVVAPYATMLALAIDPGNAVANLRQLEDLGLSGPMGLYESIDFTVQSKRGGDRGVVIYAYMAHHQGMTLLALDNQLHRGAMQRRFHADLRVRAVESLLFERIPVVKIPLEEPRSALPMIRQATAEEPAERAWKEDTYLPRVHLQGNRHYSLMVTNAGGGFSRWNEFDVTRWRSDTTLDPWGSFLYIRDVKSDVVWAAAYQPVGGAQGTSSARFSADRAEFQRRLSGVETSLHVTVAAEDDVELRRFTVMNRSIRTRHLEFTSYLELALAAHGGDKAHPAFSKMFVETEYMEPGVLIAHRRLRSPEEHPIWAAHMIIGCSDEIQYETDREKFLGRGNSPEQAAALRRDLTGSLGTVLDPIFSLRCRAVIEPRDRLEISFLTLVAPSRDALLQLVYKYRRPEAVTRAFEMAWTRAQLEFRYLGVGPAAAHRFQDLASHLLYPNARLRMPGDRLARNRLGQIALWGDGISGDLPILTITINEPRSIPLVRELLLAHAYWRLRGFKVDLVILNQEIPSYDRPLHLQLLRQVEAHGIGMGLPMSIATSSSQFPASYSTAAAVPSSSSLPP
jgi:cyclic beta-1,2-glucan synthetase